VPGRGEGEALWHEEIRRGKEAHTQTHTHTHTHTYRVYNVEKVYNEEKVTQTRKGHILHE
jgi:hypothetical protein